LALSKIASFFGHPSAAITGHTPGSCLSQSIINAHPAKYSCCPALLLTGPASRTTFVSDLSVVSCSSGTFFCCSVSSACRERLRLAQNKASMRQVRERVIGVRNGG